MRRLFLPLLIASSLCAVAAQASPITAGTYFFSADAAAGGFSLTGSFDIGSNGLITGLHNVTFHDSALGNPTFTSVSSTGVSAGFDFAYTSGSNGQLVLYYSPTLNASGDIVLCTVDSPCSGAQDAYTHIYSPQYQQNLTSGTLDPNVAAAPEPGSLALLGTGVLGAAGVLRRRIRV